eukprot:CAMPEP_0119036370 /NCGR_PEP_ID=MMETSP1177-20130426/4057_1 /TAXON_ID=2985 /ORGANISM="Ochromonas sp, Strain CCMP1899" /LENGTH=479 /DNA_ID=CAMNT_0006996171 /DNA_START=64 /DNA_END=1503 /DNA_ORIENTATION=-
MKAIVPLVASKLKPTRYEKVLSESNLNILRSCVLSNNNEALEKELLLHSKPIQSVSTNFPKIIADVCVNKKAVEFELAFDMLKCLEELKPKSVTLGLYELVDKCIECNHIDAAMKAYSQLQSKLDVSGKERLLKALSYECRIDNLMSVLSDRYVTDSDLVIVAQPLIISGNIQLFASLFDKFLTQESTVNPLQCPKRVARVLRSVMHASLRRFIKRSEPSVKESEGILDIFTKLKTYHFRLQTSNPKYLDISQSQSYLLSYQLYAILKERTEGCEFDIDLLLKEIDDDNDDGDDGDDNFNPYLLPQFESMPFPYLVEGNGQKHIENIHRVRINDLTAELKRQDPSKVLLYRDYLYPEVYDNELKLLDQKYLHGIMEDEMIVGQNNSFNEYDSNDDSSDSDSDSDDDSDIDSLETTFGDEDDDDDYSEDEEDFTKLTQQMRYTGRSSVPPSFPLHDLTNLIESNDPLLKLKFSESFFNFR